MENPELLTVAPATGGPAKLAYSLNDTATQTSQSLSTIKRDIKKGKLRAVHSGKRHLVLHWDLVSYLKSLAD